VEMELKEWVTVLPGNRYRLRTKPSWNSGSLNGMLFNTV